MSRHSLFVPLVALFAVALVSINALFWYQLRLLERDEIHRDRERVLYGFNLLQNAPLLGIGPKEVTKRLKRLGLSEVPYRPTLPKQGKLLLIDATLKTYLIDNRRHYILSPAPEQQHEPIVLRDEIEPSSFETTRYVVVGINAILTLFVLFLLRKLRPLYALKRQIRRFGQGESVNGLASDGKDEIADVANEFVRVARKIHDLQASRTLFLRNILHELNTPIAKGRLVSDMLPAGKAHDRLKRIFERMGFLLQELTQLEQLTSGELELKKGRFRLVDLCDQACDILMIDPRQITLEGACGLLDVDFDRFSIVLKNLIDNGLRYGDQKSITLRCYPGGLEVITPGQPLQKSFKEYIRPFNRPLESSHEQGLGLGLYLSDRILKAHGFGFDYRHEAGKNHFIIQF